MHIKKYYNGPLKKATLKDKHVTINEEGKDIYSYEFDIKTEKENRLFYRNFVNVIIDAETGIPVFTMAELDDLVEDHLSRYPNSNPSLEFVDTTELEKVEGPQKKEKSLVKTLVKKFRK